MEDYSSDQISGDLRQSEAYGKYMEKIGWKTIKFHLKSRKGLQQIFIRKLGPVSFAKLQRCQMPLPWKEISQILKSEKVLICKIEPESGQTEELEKHGFRISREPFLATKTLRVSLDPGLEEIAGRFKKDARYILRKLETKTLNRKANDFDEFYKIWKMSAKRKGLWIPGYKEFRYLTEVFGKNCFCITIDNSAGATIIINQKKAFYYYAGSSQVGISNNLPYLVVWEAIKEAKKRGCNSFDFEGIYDARWPNKSWLGFSHFKKSFGGDEVLYPGAFEKWCWPF